MNVTFKDELIEVEEEEEDTSITVSFGTVSLRYPAGISSFRSFAEREKRESPIIPPQTTFIDDSLNPM